MNTLKPLLIVAVLAGIGYGVYVRINGTATTRRLPEPPTVGTPRACNCPTPPAHPARAPGAAPSNQPRPRRRSPVAAPTVERRPLSTAAGRGRHAAPASLRRRRPALHPPAVVHPAPRMQRHAGRSRRH